MNKLPTLAIFALFLLSSTTYAAVTANVDRARVEQNESFTLEIVIDSNTDLAPDLSVLDDDFYIGQTSQLSNTFINNGQISRSRTWQVALRPRRAGELTIPPIQIGTEQSQALKIVVREPSYEPPGEADVFITAEVDYDETYVQAQVLYKIKIYRAVATRQPALREPTFSGAEILVELAGDERSYEAVLSDRAYNVVERSFALFPQESGEVQISPARFEARVLRDGRITGRKVFESEPKSIVVNPIPAPPAEFPGATWLPAREVTLSDEWSREPDRLRAGEPISRNITVSALGQLETQIPAIEPPQAEGVSVYPDKPVLNRRLEAGGIRGMRTDQYAMIGVDAGTVTLPKLELPWWDIAAAEWRVATVPEQSVNIQPSADEPLIELTPADAEVDDGEAADASQETVVVHSEFWRRAAEILAAVWLLTLIGWYWSSRPTREAREPEPPPLHKRQARTLKDARKAAVAGDPVAVRQALLDWARLQWPDDTPRSIGELANRVTAPLSDELYRLSRASYGRGGENWDGGALARAIRSFGIVEDSGDEGGDAILPPLMPGSS